MSPRLAVSSIMPGGGQQVIVLGPLSPLLVRRALVENVEVTYSPADVLSGQCLALLPAALHFLVVVM